MTEPNLERLLESVLEKSRSTKSLAVCVGAGASIAAGMPAWPILSQELVEYWMHLTPDEPDSKEIKIFISTSDTSELLELVARDVGTKKVIEFIRRKIKHSQLQPTELHAALASLPANVFITTNYDTLIEKAFSSQGKSFSLIASDEDVRLLRPDSLSIIKLFGSIDRPSTMAFSLKRDSVTRANRETLDSYLRTLFAASLVLFVGYSVQEEWFQDLYERYRGTSEIAADWIVLTPSENLLTKNLWESRGVRFAEMEFSHAASFIRLLGQRLKKRESSRRIVQRKKRVFISGNVESLALIKQVRRAVETAGYEPVVAADFFSPGMTIFERLTDLIKSASAAIIILSPETESSDREMASQNMLFELGYLTGHLGRDHVLTIVHRDLPKMPSDLTGISFVIADPTRPQIVSKHVRDWLLK